MGMFEYNGFSKEVDLMDADVMKKFEEGLETVRGKMISASEKGLKGYESMNIQIASVDEFFDTLFGERTAVELFGGSRNLRPRLEAFELASNLMDEFYKEVGQFKNRSISNARNRAQRRASQKKK